LTTKACIQKSSFTKRETKKIKDRIQGSGLILNGCETKEESKERNNKSPQKKYSFAWNIYTNLHKENEKVEFLCLIRPQKAVFIMYLQYLQINLIANSNAIWRLIWDSTANANFT
jgi:hypothetical protein